MTKKTIKTKGNEEIEMHNDEFYIEMISAMGCLFLKGPMPNKMKDGLIKTYLESKTVNSTYLFINGEEITDNKNHNPFNQDS